MKTTPDNEKRAASREQGVSGHKAHRARRIVSNILIACGVALLLYAAGSWGLAQYNYWKQDQENKKLATYASVPTRESEAPTVDWEGLKAVNGDVVGWLEVPGTTVNYPVYQGEDNTWYLRHSAEGYWTIGGQVFMDYQNTAPGLVDNQTILYGHHLKDGSMFYPLFLLNDQATFDATNTVWYVTEGGAVELEPLMVYYTDPNDQNVRRFQFASDDEFRSYLMGLLGKSVTRRADAETIISGTSHVLTMSTCNYYEGYGRSLLVCVPKSEAQAATVAASV